MHFHGGAINQNLRRRSAGLRECVEHVGPYALFRPPDEAVVERLARPVFGWRIDPAATRLQHVHDAADHATIIDARFTARIGRQMWFDLRKLRVRQPELIAIHPRFLSEAVNHNALLMPTLLWVRTLGSQGIGLPIVPLASAARLPNFRAAAIHRHNLGTIA